MSETNDTRIEDDELAAATRELCAQLSIMNALKPLEPGARGRVLQACTHLIAANLLCPGMLKAFCIKDAPPLVQ